MLRVNWSGRVLHQSGALSDGICRRQAEGSRHVRAALLPRSNHGRELRAATLRHAIEIFISPSDENIANLDQLLTADANGLDPEHARGSGLSDLQASLAFRGCLLDVDIQFDTLDVFGNRGLAEFRVAGLFSGPFVIDETVVIEPNHRTLLLGAAAVADFENAKIRAVRADFDDSSLLEQMLAA